MPISYAFAPIHADNGLVHDPLFLSFSRHMALPKLSLLVTIETEVAKFDLMNLLMPSREEMGQGDPDQSHRPKSRDLHRISRCEIVVHLFCFVIKPATFTFPPCQAYSNPPPAVQRVSPRLQQAGPPKTRIDALEAELARHEEIVLQLRRELEQERRGGGQPSANSGYNGSSYGPSSNGTLIILQLFNVVTAYCSYCCSR